jgi:predicted NBD/HSP70 family sugar kinase
MAVTAAQGNFWIALQLGGSHARAGFFKFLDNTIKSTTRIIEKPSSQADGLLKEVVEKANKQVGRSLAQPVPVLVSFAGPVEEDAKTATPGNFKINGGKGAINLEEHLNGINPDGVKFEVKVLNDATALINAAAISNKNLLEPGDKVYHAIMGTGMGGAGGTIAKDGGVTEINANEPGHEKMPYVEKFKLIEGTDRQQMTSPLTKKKGYVELYTAGGNTDDRGLVATVNNFTDMMHARGNSQKDRFIQAKDLLKQTLEENSVEGFEEMSTITVENSRIIEKGVTLSNKNITQAAKDGDEFAKALITFTLIRASQALAQSINSQGKDKPVALVSINGSFNRGLREAVDPNGDLQFRVVNAELKKLGHLGIKDNDPNRLVQFDPELDGTPLILEKQLREAVIS